MWWYVRLEVFRNSPRNVDQQKGKERATKILEAPRPGWIPQNSVAEGLGYETATRIGDSDQNVARRMIHAETPPGLLAQSLHHSSMLHWTKAEANLDGGLGVIGQQND